MRKPPLHTIMTREEERELIRQGQRGDTDARNKVVMNCSAIIWKWAHYYVPGYTSRTKDAREAMHQHVIAFLCERFPDFQLKRNVRFLTWATWWIRQQCMVFKNLYLHEGIRLPMKDLKTPSLREKIRGFSLFAPVDEFGMTFEGQLVNDDPLDEWMEEDDRQHRIRWVREVMQEMKPRDRAILLLRASGMTLEQVGNQKHIKVTKERVRQLEKRAFLELSERLYMASIKAKRERKASVQQQPVMTPVRDIQAVRQLADSLGGLQKLKDIIAVIEDLQKGKGAA